MIKSINKIRKYGEHLFLLKMMKARMNVFQSVSPEDGIDYIVKGKSGIIYEISLQTLNRERDMSLKIPKTDIGYEIKDNFFIALIVFSKEIEPIVYLFPFKVFENPGRIFLVNEQSERFRHLSNWEIKIFTNAIPELAKYEFNSMILELI